MVTLIPTEGPLPSTRPARTTISTIALPTPHSLVQISEAPARLPSTLPALRTASEAVHKTLEALLRPWAHITVPSRLPPAQRLFDRQVTAHTACRRPTIPTPW